MLDLIRTFHDDDDDDDGLCSPVFHLPVVKLERHVAVPRETKLRS